jgi:hypothetical protein
MKILVSVIGVLLILMGIVWFLQGIKVLPGSFMTGQPKWAVFGGLAVIVGILFLTAANRGKAPRPPAPGGPTQP